MRCLQCSAPQGSLVNAHFPSLPLHLAPLSHLALVVGVPSLQCTLRYPGTQVPGYLLALSSTDNNAPFFHPALVGPRPGEVCQGEPLRDRAEEEEQDVRLHHGTLRYGKHPDHLEYYSYLTSQNSLTW